MRRRLPRRQGVVYGPLAHQERADSGGVLGRILGAVVVLGAVGMLAIAGLSFLGDGGVVAPASPTPTAAAPAEATATPTASPRPRPSPTASPTPEPTPTPTPTPTEFAVEVREGPGQITFGANYRTNPARIIDPSATFGTDGQIAWLANIDGRAGTRELQIVAARYDPADGSETVTYDQDFDFRNANASIFLRRFRNIGALIDGPGVYVVRYIVEGETRAEGHFRVEED